MSLEENIRISEMTNSSDVRTAAEQAGVEVDSASFPDGYSTMLSRSSTAWTCP